MEIGKVERKGSGNWRKGIRMKIAGKQSHLCGFPSVHFVPCSQLPISVISLHKDSAKFIHQTKVIVAKSTE